MRLFSQMIAIKYDRTGDVNGNRYFMKRAACPRCKDFYEVPVLETYHKCAWCKCRMRYSWIEIDAPDYTEEYADGKAWVKDKRVKEAGKQVKKYHS